MKMFVTRIPVSQNDPFILNDVKLHLRQDLDDEDSLILNMAATAAAEIEHFAQVALLHQTIKITVVDPIKSETTMVLPVGPMSETDIPSVTIDGADFTDFTVYTGQRPVIVWPRILLYNYMTVIQIEYRAGFGPTAADIPEDLAQALMDQVALHYDGRSPMSSKRNAMSPHMARIAAKYRGVRV